MPKKSSPNTEANKKLPDVDNKITKAVKACDHVYLVTKAVTHGGAMRVTQMRCSKCLIPVDVEALQWKDDERLSA